MPVATRRIQLRALPIAVARASDAHVESMLAAAESAIAEDGAGLTSSLALVVRSLSDEYAEFSSGPAAAMDAAEAAGAETLDLDLEAPVTMASAAETWLRLLEHLDDLAAAGQFEHGGTPEDIRRFRRWLVDEITGQLRDGRPPAEYDASA